MKLKSIELMFIQEKVRFRSITTVETSVATP